MIRRTLLTCVLLFAAVEVAASETIQVPLPALQGRYYVDWPAQYYNRTAHFELARMPMTVYNVQLHISGTFTVGSTFCDFVPNQQPFPQGIAYSATILDTIHADYFYTDQMSSNHNETFDYTEPFEKILPDDATTWTFLQAGYGEIDMMIGFVSFPECSILVWPEATIESAELIIEADFRVSVEARTWGSIKALYR